MTEFATIPDILEVTLRDGSYLIDFQFTAQDTATIAAALESVGLAIISLREPKPDAKWPQAKRWSRIPLFLWLKARRRDG